MADPVMITEEADVVMEGDDVDAAEGIAEDGDGLPGPGIVDVPSRTSFLEYVSFPKPLTLQVQHKPLTTSSQIPQIPHR